MPPAAETVNLVGRDGSVLPVSADQVAEALANGFTIESPDAAASRLASQAREQQYGGIIGTGGALAAGLARGATFGGSDVLLGGLGYGEDLQALRDVNQTASTIGEVGGALLPALAAPESLLARTPAGLTAKLGSRIAGLGEGAGVVGRVAASAAGAATEGALQNAGSYISDVALGDRELSADGFMGAMGKGALWGGVAGGALSVAGEGLTAARRLFPRQEVTREAVRAAEVTAREEVSSAVRSSDEVISAARDRLRQLRADAAAADIATKQRLDAIAIKKAEDVAAANVRAAEAKAATAEAKLAKAKEPRKVRRAVQEEAETATQPAAVADAVTEDAATSLERQLMATKQGLDAGKSLADLNARPIKATHIEDALNAEVARTNPEAAKLTQALERLEGSKSVMDEWLGKYGKTGNVGKFERGQSARDWAANVRPKEEGWYTKLAQDSQTPGMSEGSLGLARGKQMVWRGSDEAQRAAEAKILSRLSPEEMAAADQAVAEAARRSKGIAADVVEQPSATAETIEQTVDDKVGEALGSKVDSIDDDIAQTAPVISSFEAAMADASEALGPMAPPAAQARAQAFREAQQGAHSATADAAARATEAADTAAARGLTQEVLPPGGAPKAGGLLETAKNAGSALEILRMLGVPVPDPAHIPVIGPILSTYLKARVLGKTFGRFGGKVAETAETTIASKAAATKQRVYEALDRMTEVGAKATKQAATKSGGVAAIIGHKLFDDGKPSPKPYSSDAKVPDLATAYLARADELARASQPGAIEKAVRARVQASDPAIMKAIVDAQTRKLEFISSKMPRPFEPALPTQTRMPWVPSRAELGTWARYVEAAEDPVGVIERAANDGHVTAEAAETLRTVYPKLFAEAQQRILTRAMDAEHPIPYARRVQMSIMFDMPMDASQLPAGARFLQQSYQPPPQTPQPQPLSATPTVRADVQMAERTDPTT